LLTVANALMVTLACLAFPAGASGAEGLAPSQAAHRLKPQYHCDLPAEILRAERGAKPIVAVSRGVRSAVSHREMPGNLVGIGDSIQAQMCRSIVSRIAGNNSVETVSYLRPEVRSKFHSNPKAAQYHSRRGRYQPSPIEAAVAKSAQGAEQRRGDTALMVKIGLLLGLAYLAFLTLWIWATRVRPRHTRPRRGI
jgi:hypothetical protein